MNCRDCLVGWLLVGVLVSLPTGARIATAQTEPDQRREQLKALSRSDKRELLAKKDRFDRLPPAEKQRLRELDRQVQEHAQATELRQVLQRYGQWLAELSAKEKSELQDLNVDKRLERIQILRQREEDRRLSRLGMTTRDANTVYQWWVAVTEQHEERLVASLSQQERDAYDRAARDPRTRPRALRAAGWRSMDSLLARVPRENINQLIDQLSQEAREKFLESQLQDDQNKVLEKWIRESTRHRMRPPRVGDAELLSMISTLPQRERAQLEKLPRAELLQRLRERWENQQMWQRMRYSRRFRRSSAENHRRSDGRSRGQGRPGSPPEFGPGRPERHPLPPAWRDREGPDGGRRRGTVRPDRHGRNRSDDRDRKPNRENPDASDKAASDDGPIPKPTAGDASVDHDAD